MRLVSATAIGFDASWSQWEDEMWAEIIRRFEAVHARDAVKIVIIREGEEYPEGTPSHPGDKVVVRGR